MSRSKSLFFFMTALVIFGTNGLLADKMSMSSAEIILMRTSLGFIFLLAVVLAKRCFSFAELRADLIPATVGGAALGLNWVLLFGAYRYAGVSLSTLTNYCGPMIVLALSPLIFKEKFTWVRLLAIAAVALGMVCITGSIDAGSDTRTGLLLGAGAGLLYSVLIIATKNVRHMSGLNCAAYELFIAFIVIVIYLLASGVQLPVIPTAADLPYVLIIGFVNTGLAYYLYFSSLQALPAQTSALVSYLEPLTALIVSALFLGEKLGGVQMLGAVLILGGAFVGELRAEK